MEFTTVMIVGLVIQDMNELLDRRLHRRLKARFCDYKNNSSSVLKIKTNPRPRCDGSVTFVLRAREIRSTMEVLTTSIV